MKQNLLVIGLFFLSVGLFAQTKEHRFGITAGGGSQKYCGDLGNGFTIKNNTWYGQVSLNANFYLTRSFDIGVFSSTGDYGFCQPEGSSEEVVPFSERCVGCIGRVSLGNLNSRLTVGGALIKFKLANGYLLKEENKIKPYIYAGAAFNRITDIMKMKCVNPGNYFSFNAGAGAKYYLTKNINLGYNLGLGYLTKDRLDNMTHGTSDMYLQNTILLGIDL